MRRADVIAAIEKRQDFNTSGGPNWTPAVAAKARNELLISLLVELGLKTEKEARAEFRKRKDDRDRRLEETAKRVTEERRREADGVAA